MRDRGQRRAPGRPAAARARRSQGDGRRAAPSGSRRSRPVSLASGGSRARAPGDHRRRDRATADVERARDPVGRVQRRDLQLRRAARPPPRLGHRFRTQSDTEVILHAYEEWAEAAFERLNGQFAIALWDVASETLVLARDRLGVRPLYLCEHGGRLWFASEVKALFAGDPSIDRELDPVGLIETFTFWSTVPPQAVFAGISELEPGHLRIVTPTGSTDVAFWTPTYPVDAELDLPWLARRCRRTHACGARGGRGAADAARRRPGRQLSLRRPRQLPDRGARRPCDGPAVPHLLDRFRRRRVRRDALPASHGGAARQPPPRAGRRSTGHRGRLPRGRRACGAPAAEDRARPAVPAVRARPGVGHQGRPDRRGRRRDVRRLRPVQGGQDPPLLGTGPGLGAAAAAARAPLPVPGSITGLPADDGARVLRARPGALGRARVRPSPALEIDRRAPAPARARHPPCGREANVVERLLGLAARRVRALVVPRPGPVPRGANAADRVSPLLAGRPHADGAFRGGPLPVPRHQRHGPGEHAASLLQASRARREARAQAGRPGSRPGRDRPAPQAAISRTRRDLVHRRPRPGMGRRADQRTVRGARRDLRPVGRRPAVAEVSRLVGGGLAVECRQHGARRRALDRAAARAARAGRPGQAPAIGFATLVDDVLPSPARVALAGGGTG